jgi:pyruvyltransferase
VTLLRNTRLWKLSKHIALDPARRLAVKISWRNHIPLFWCAGRNWGDVLSPFLVKILSGKRVVHLAGLHHDRYLAIGSILGGANERAEVWGSGFIREDERLFGSPRAVHAVRGPLSREQLLLQGVDCPEVYGDPALLLPCFYNPDVKKQHAVGIVPHYLDKEHPWVTRQAQDPQIKILDIESGIHEFVRDVKSCDTILSSSLHGLICADSYGIPNTWIRLSDAVIGGGFKFRDYRRSIGADDPIAVEVVEDTRLEQLVAKAANYQLKIDLKKLILACPFLSPRLHKEINQNEFGVVATTLQESILASCNISY